MRWAIRWKMSLHIYCRIGRDSSAKQRMRGVIGDPAHLLAS